jgi:hypothetical protein
MGQSKTWDEAVARIVAGGSDYAEVSAKADASGERDVLILKTPPLWAAFGV